MTKNMCFTLLTSWEFVDFWVMSRLCVCMCIGERGKEGDFVSVYVCPYYREPPTAACLSWCLTHGEIYTGTLHPCLCHSVHSHVLLLYTLNHFLFLHIVPYLPPCLFLCVFLCLVSFCIVPVVHCFQKCCLTAVFQAGGRQSLRCVWVCV